MKNKHGNENKSDFVEMIDQQVDDIKACVNLLNKTVNKFKKAPVEHYRLLRFKTFRYVDYWIANGMSKNEAINLIATDLEESPYDLEIGYNTYNKHHKALERYVRKRFIQLMRKNGFPITEIAKMLKVSVGHAYKLSKEKLNVNPYLNV